MSAGSVYLRLRNGKAFIVGLIAFCVAWWGWNLIPGLPHFDPTLALLMMILSVEASTSTAVISAQNQSASRLAAEQDAREERQLRYIGSLLEGQAAVMKALRDQLLTGGHDTGAASMDAAARSPPAGGCQQPSADGVSMREHSSTDRPIGGAHVAALGAARAGAGGSMGTSDG